MREKLALFESAGIHLREDRTLDDLVLARDETEILAAGNLTLLAWLGRCIDREPYDEPLSDDIYWFDWEDLSIDGMYVRWMEAVERLSKGAFVFDDIDERMDFDIERLNISFSLNGTVYYYEGEQLGDWISPDYVLWLMDLLNNGSREQGIIYIDTGGQDAMIAYGTRQSIDRLRTITGRPVNWLR